MKKWFGILIAFTVLLSTAPAFAAAGQSQMEMLKESYSDTGSEASIEITLSGTPGNLTTVTLPTTAKGFRLYPRTNHVRFAVYNSDSARTLAAVATDSDGTVAAADLAIGGIAKNDQWETRLLPAEPQGSVGRVLTLRSTTASVVVDLETF